MNRPWGVESVIYHRIKWKGVSNNLYYSDLFFVKRILPSETIIYVFIVKRPCGIQHPDCPVMANTSYNQLSPTGTVCHAIRLDISSQYAATTSKMFSNQCAMKTSFRICIDMLIINL